MPKQIWKIDQFHGGLNSNSDPRDIARNEMSVATDVMVDQIGRIKLIGDAVTHDEVPINTKTGFTGTLTPGRGLFQFSSDRVGAEDAGTSEAETGDDYLALFDDNDQQVWIYSKSADVWDDDVDTANSGVIDIGSSGSAEPVFYYIDGALRVTDGNHGPNNSTKWYGYIKQEMFRKVPQHSTNIEGGSGCSSASDQTITGGDVNGQFDQTVTGGAITSVNIDFSGGGYDSVGDASFATGCSGVIAFDGNNYLSEIDGWYSEDNDLSAPTHFTTTADAPATDKVGFNLGITMQADTESTWEAETYDIASSFIYDGHQESLLYKSANTFVVAAGEKVKLIAYVRNPTAWTTKKQRVVGGRVYCKASGSTDDWSLLCDITWENGLRVKLNSDDWGEWAETAADDLETASVDSLELNPDTYKSINGFSPDVSTITNDSYRSAAVSGRVVYVGAPKRKDDKGVERVMADSMFKSMPNRFDTFPTTNRVDAAVQDGEDIVHLESYADRILQFKEKTLYIINVSQDIEFLEDTYKFKGVMHPGAVARTDFGIVWANNLGCYFYDGRNVTNLIEKNMVKLILDTDWNAFVTDNTIVTYVPKKRHIIVLKDCTATSDGDIYLYDMVTKSWVQGDSAFVDSQIKTNFIIDWNNDPVLYRKGSPDAVNKWDGVSAQTVRMEFNLGDIDFDAPGQNKKIYKVYVTYQSANNVTNVIVDYDVDGGTSFGYDFKDGTNFTSNELDAANGWKVAELKPDTPSEADNIKSFSLRFQYESGKIVPKEFEVNDISIIYRPKPLK